MRYDGEMARGIAKVRKEVSRTLGREGESKGSPPLGVFEFHSLFQRRANDNRVSEGRALYLLPEFTKGSLKRDLFGMMPSIQGDRAGEVSSYLELLNWLRRKYAADEAI